jgi:ABC-type antimicrobial peptide transport system permease subunit
MRRFGMKKNMGIADRTIRILIAILLGILILAGQIVGVTATILGIAAIVLLLTSVIGFCPLYVPLKRSTLKKP